MKKEFPHHNIAELDYSSVNVLVRGDTKLLLRDYDAVGGHDSMCHLWFNTHFVNKNVLVFEKEVVDRAVKDTAQRYFSDDFKVEVYLQEVDEDLDLQIESADDDDQSSDGGTDGDGDA